MRTSATVLLDQTGGAVVLEFFDMQGRSIRSEKQAVQERRIIVPRNGLTPGSYLLRITGDKAIGSKSSSWNSHPSAPRCSHSDRSTLK
ncbi:MAG: T9SS type A sorting domain-containing protein [Flavobacteriales bacterium]|nr:T9SS type A sorting domain-containing protein [Flavobacteriales bacterium]